MKLNKKQKRQVMLVSGTLFYLSALFTPTTISLILFLIAYFILVKKIIQKLFVNLNLSTIFSHSMIHKDLNWQIGDIFFSFLVF